MKDRVLLNISNHPSSEWLEEQMQAAKKEYSSVVDFAHPPVSPQMTTQEVYELAVTVRDQVRTMAPTAIHVMGEHTFCFALVSLLQKDGFLCLASTTTRSATKINSSEVRRLFNFSGFRPYPSF